MFVEILSGCIVLGFALMFFFAGIGGITGNLPPPPHFSIISIAFGALCLIISMSLVWMAGRIFMGKGPLYD